MKRYSSTLYPLLFGIICILIWQYLASGFQVAFWILPSPLKVFKVFIEHWQLLWLHARYTIIATLSGLFASLFIGIFTAILMDNIRPFRQIFYPYLIVSQTVPIIAVAPLLIIWFGYGISAKIFAVILICFFPITLNLYDGFRQIVPDQIRLLRSMGGSAWKIFRHLKLPSAMPNLFTGLKLAATYSVMGAVIGEWLGGYAGLGIYMTRAAKSFRTDHVFAIIFSIVALSLALYGIVIVLERILLRWYFQRTEEYIEP
ncbi:MAG: ABC transporter permease [Candidatus Cloacimonetes bacterium]|nr:ABC transporter permease [Candidatus Cloacimonadota bacterium]